MCACVCVCESIRCTLSSCFFFFFGSLNAAWFVSAGYEASEFTV